VLAWLHHTARSGPWLGGSTRDARDDPLAETSMPFALGRPLLMHLAASPRVGVGLGERSLPDPRPLVALRLPLASWPLCWG